MLGINLLLWKLCPTAEDKRLLMTLSEMGYRLVEVPIFALDEGECHRLATICDELGLARTALAARGAEDNPIAADLSARRLAVERSKVDIDKAVALGSRLLAGPIHGPFGVFTGQPPTADERRWARDHLAAVASYAMTRGVTLSIEWLNRFESHFLNSTQQAADFLAELDAPNVGILYDSFHSNIEDPNIMPTIRDHAARINHVHLSESHRGTLGTGMVHWQHLFEALRTIGYRGDMVVEIFSPSVSELVPLVHLWRKTFDTEDQAARDALAFVSAQVGPARAAA